MFNIYKKTQLELNNQNWRDILNKKIFNILLKTTNAKNHIDVSIEAPIYSGRSTYVVQLAKFFQNMDLTPAVLSASTPKKKALEKRAKELETGFEVIDYGRNPTTVSNELESLFVDILIIDDADNFGIENWPALISSKPLMIIAVDSGCMNLHTSLCKSFWDFFVNKPNTYNFFVQHDPETEFRISNNYAVMSDEEKERNFLIR